MSVPPKLSLPTFKPRKPSDIRSPEQDKVSNANTLPTEIISTRLLDWPSIDEMTMRLPLIKEDLSFQLYTLLPKRIMGFSIVGGGVMVGGIMLIFVLVHFLHVEQDLAYLIQAVTCIEANFFLNRFTNWKDRTGNLLAQWVKFHSTSVFTFLLNQAQFAILIRLGVSYLIVTILGAGLAAVINYVTNDRFVFHGQDIALLETRRIQATQPVKQLPRIGVVIPVRNSQGTIRRCIESVLSQDYAGIIDIFIVGNPPEQDATWQELDDMKNIPTIHSFQLVRPANISGRDANMKRYRGSQEALRYGADIVAFLDSQVEAPTAWLSTGVHLLNEHRTDGIAGISCHHHQDHTLSGSYQDGSFFSEWPRYGSGFVLNFRNSGQARGWPITANLFLTKEALIRLGRFFPRTYTSSWEDFQLDWELVQAGCTIFCTDQIRVYRNHVHKFRLAKQFSSGIGAIVFYRDNPRCLYAQRRIFELGLVLLCLFLVCAGGLLLYTIGTRFEQMAFLLIVVALTVFLSVASIWKARDWRGMLFPLFDVLHVGTWIAGALYALLHDGSVRPTVNNVLIRLR